MKVAYWAFWSQQHKRTGEFLPTCHNVKQLVFLARSKDVIAAPQGAHLDVECEQRRVQLPQQNPVQRVHWDTEDLCSVFCDADVAVTNHEYLSIPLRALFPRLKIVQLVNVRPDTVLFSEAWRAADLVVAQSASTVPQTRTPTSWWPMAYDERLHAGRRPAARDVDVFFIQRCSYDNSTHHLEMVEIQDLYHTVFADVTGLLRKSCPDLRYSTAETFVDTLYRSKVAVSLHASPYGGVSVREAIRAGCVPVVRRTRAMVELCGRDWPCFVSHVDVDTLKTAIDAALQYSGPLPNVSQESYQAGALRAQKDIDDLFARRS